MPAAIPALKDIEAVIRHNHSRQGSKGQAAAYAKAVNQGAQCVWAMPATDSMAAMSGELARVAVEMERTVQQHISDGSRTMICIAVLPSDEIIEMTER